MVGVVCRRGDDNNEEKGSGLTCSKGTSYQCLVIDSVPVSAREGSRRLTDFRLKHPVVYFTERGYGCGEEGIKFKMI